MGILMLIILILSVIVFLATIYILRKRKKIKEKGDELQAILAFTRAFKEILSPIPNSLQYEAVTEGEKGKITLRLQYHIGLGLHDVARKIQTFKVSADKQFLYTKNGNMVSFIPPYRFIDTKEGIKLNGVYILYYSTKNISAAGLPKHFHEQYCMTTAWTNAQGIRSETMKHLKQIFEDFNGISEYPEYRIES